MAQALMQQPSAAQAAQLNAQAKAFELQAARTSRVVAQRYAFWSSLVKSANAANLNLSDGLPADVVSANATSDRNAVRWATAVIALDRGDAQLAAWTPDGGATLKLGVVVAGSLPLTLSVWPIVPILYYGAAAVASVGVWLLADAFLDADMLEKEAALTYQRTQAAAQDAVIRASAAGPQYGQMVADAIATAQKAATAPATGVLSSLAQSVKAAAEGVSSIAKSSPTTLLLVAAGLYLASRFTGGSRGRA